MTLRPQILVNVAMTADGKIDSTARKGTAISSVADKRHVDHLRASVDPVLLGGRTLLNEDPKLTVKSVELLAARLSKGWPENPAKVGVVTDIGVSSAQLGGEMVTRNGRGQALPLRQFLTTDPAQVYLFTTRCSDT